MAALFTEGEVGIVAVATTGETYSCRRVAMAAGRRVRTPIIGVEGGKKPSAPAQNSAAANDTRIVIAGVTSHGLNSVL